MIIALSTDPSFALLNQEDKPIINRLQDLSAGEIDVDKANLLSLARAASLLVGASTKERNTADTDWDDNQSESEDIE